MSQLTIRISRTLNIRLLCMAPANATIASKCSCLSPVGPGGRFSGHLTPTRLSLASCTIGDSVSLATTLLTDVGDVIGWDTMLVPAPSDADVNNETEKRKTISITYLLVLGLTWWKSLELSSPVLMDLSLRLCFSDLHSTTSRITESTT